MAEIYMFTLAALAALAVAVSHRLAAAEVGACAVSAEARHYEE